MPEPADKLPDGATLTSSIPVAIPPKQEGLYREVLSILEDRHVPYAVAGAFALQQHTGICRYTKDLDIFLRSEDVEIFRVAADSGVLLQRKRASHKIGRAHV